jgi:hypothetical protein
VLFALQRRAVARICPPPHAARLRRVVGGPKLPVISKLAANLPLGQRLSAEATGALCSISEAMTLATTEPWLEIVKHADATTAQRALRSPMAPQSARTSGTVTMRAVTCCKSSDEEFSRITLSQG